MKTRILIIIPIIVGLAISFPFLLEQSRSLYPKSNEDTFKHKVETDFMNKIKETGNNSTNYYDFSFHFQSIHILLDQNY